MSGTLHDGARCTRTPRAHAAAQRSCEAAVGQVSRPRGPVPSNAVLRPHTKRVCLTLHVSSQSRMKAAPLVQSAEIAQYTSE